MNNSHLQACNKHPLDRQSQAESPKMMESPAFQKALQPLSFRQAIFLSKSRRSHTETFKNEDHQNPVTAIKRGSFSDILAPQDINTAVNLSLEKELENNMHKSLNTMSNNRSNTFEQSSIHKDENNPPDILSGFDLKEQDILLDENILNNIREKANKRTCILCHNSQDTQKAILGPRQSQDIWEYELIFPCLCNIKAHRECLKSYILMKKVVNCERCKTSYAVSGKRMRDIKLSKKNSIFAMIASSLFVIAAIAGVALIASGFAISPNVAALWVVGIVSIAIGVLGITYILWKRFLSSKIVDIAMNCKQTEIARHEEDPERLFYKFVQREEEKRHSQVLAKARRITNLLDVGEFENFVKMTTPRVDKEDKEIVVRFERNGSSHFLVPDGFPVKSGEEFGDSHKAQKEIFIAPAEFDDDDRSRMTAADNMSNINEHSAKLKNSGPPKIRISPNHPSKHTANLASNGWMKRAIVNLDARLPIRKNGTGTFGSQSERRFNYPGIVPHHIEFAKLSSKEPPSAISLRNQGVSSARDQLDRENSRGALTIAQSD